MEYDYRKAKDLITSEIESDESLVSAYLGMAEDWGWTAEEVWNKTDGFIVDLDSVTHIAGIDGSFWATPSLQLYYSDNKSKLVSCCK